MVYVFRIRGVRGPCTVEKTDGSSSCSLLVADVGKRQASIFAGIAFAEAGFAEILFGEAWSLSPNAKPTKFAEIAPHETGFVVIAPHEGGFARIALGEGSHASPSAKPANDPLTKRHFDEKRLTKRDSV